MEKEPAINNPTELLFKAIRVATQAHEGQFRKGSRLPNITHPVNVMKILIEQGCDEEIVAAGILHDTLEDTHMVFGMRRSKKKE